MGVSGSGEGFLYVEELHAIGTLSLHLFASLWKAGPLKSATELVCLTLTFPVVFHKACFKYLLALFGLQVADPLLY